MCEKIFVTGIDTEVGKTIISAVLVEAMVADYWKPIQAGDLDYSDTMKVRDLVSNDTSVFFEENYRLKTPASPHLAARLDDLSISIEQINAPRTSNNLIIEGAGGLMVPINDEGDFILDLVEKMATKIVLVSKNYLGSINHTVSAFEMLKSRGLKVDLLVFSGHTNFETESIIEKHILPKSVLKFPFFEQLNSRVINEFSCNNKKLIFSGFS
ncbi:MAG: dethiobiotin synthase [Crocinitomicaceae bacterium]|nr:dethiobiotin synthase [Crocinitomicaceae bacterium]